MKGLLQVLCNLQILVVRGRSFQINDGRRGILSMFSTVMTDASDQLRSIDFEPDIYEEWLRNPATTFNSPRDLQTLNLVNVPFIPSLNFSSLTHLHIGSFVDSPALRYNRFEALICFLSRLPRLCVLELKIWQTARDYRELGHQTRPFVSSFLRSFLSQNSTMIFALEKPLYSPTPKHFASTSAYPARALPFMAGPI